MYALANKMSRKSKSALSICSFYVPHFDKST
jgi:hypothetical protein